MEKNKGKFIVLYGINNLGKTTQAEKLVEKLKNEGKEAEYLKYPIYKIKASGEILNNYLRGKNEHNLTPKEAQIIYAINRSQYEKILLEKLESGINIIAEDYVGTGIAWGIGAGVNEQFLKKINSHLLKEDLGFLFDGKRFIESIEESHKHETNENLMNKVRDIHLKLAEEFDWVKINVNLSIEEIHKELYGKVKEIIE